MTDLKPGSAPDASPDPDSDDFDAAWREFFQRQRGKLDVVKAAIRLTEGGAHPVEIERLATVVDLPVEAVRRRIDQADAGLPSVRIWHTGDQVWLDFATTGEPRFWYVIGDRRIGVAGCGPDIFGVAHALRQPMRAEATCPATGTRIAIDFTPDGVRDVQPAEAVVSVMHLRAVPEAAELTDSARVDADVCTQQMFFASAEAAESWLESHPGGRVVPVVAFDQWLRRVRAAATRNEDATDQ